MNLLHASVRSFTLACSLAITTLAFAGDDAPVSPPPAPVAPSAASSSSSPPAPSQEDTDHAEGSRGETHVWPSLLLEPGAGAIVAPSAVGGGWFGVGLGAAILTSGKGDTDVSSHVGIHAGYTVAPVANRAELTLRGALGVSGPWMVGLVGGGTLDTTGVPGFRAGAHVGLFHVIGFDVSVHHAFASRKETSVFLTIPIDLVPLTLGIIFVHSMTSIFR